MRVAWLPHSLNPAYAGVRLRCLLPAAALRRAGQACAVWSDVRNECPDVLAVQGKWLLDAGSPRELAARMRRLRALKTQGTRLLLDSFDNYFLNDAANPTRAALLEAYADCLGDFAAFSVSSSGLVPYLRERVGSQAQIMVIGDPVEGPGAHRDYEAAWQRVNPKRWPGHLQAVVQRVGTRLAGARAIQLLWFGNQGSQYAKGGMDELTRILPHLDEAARVQPLRLTVVSNSQTRYQELMAPARFAHRYLDWDRLHFARLLQVHDAVLLPSEPTAFTKGKSNNRLILPLSMGVPVIADPLPDYLPWADHFAVASWDRLAQTLHMLNTYREKALTAQPRIAATFTPKAIAQRWLETFCSMAAP